jgi:hypothetical protein
VIGKDSAACRTTLDLVVWGSFVDVVEGDKIAQRKGVEEAVVDPASSMRKLHMCKHVVQDVVEERMGTQKLPRVFVAYVDVPWWQ